VTNRTARTTRAAAGVREDLAKSVMCPVRWDDATSLMAELGCALFVEVLPGRVLSRLAAGSASLPRAVALADTGLRSAAVRVRRASGGEER
jgi:malonate decarboxylase epsilon subunit